MKYFTADWHCYHKNIRTLASRPFDSDEEMREALINNFNSRVTNEDEVYILGDFLWKDAEINNILPRLNRKTITLICGNHDQAHLMHRKSTKFVELMKKGGFDEVYDELMIALSGYQVKLSHFPYWDKKETDEHELRYQKYRPIKGSEQFLIHGHVHAKPANRLRLKPAPALDVGVDPFSFFPVSETEILSIIQPYL